MILIANPGSTSYKCKVFDADSMNVIFQASVERIGDKIGFYSYSRENDTKITRQVESKDYFAAVNLTIETLRQFAPIERLSAVGFKTVLAKGVTGCEYLSDDVIKAMEEYLPLAPVHNKVYLTAISVFKDILPGIPLIGLFETAFHQTIPREAYLYGIPYPYFEKYGIRKYGFHGASHRYIYQRAAQLYSKNKDCFKVISCHLGGSSSIAAIKNGLSVDTSMGMSPQCGLLNSYRVGDIDSFALLYLMEKERWSIEQTRQKLILESGVYGLSGVSGDFRDIEIAMKKGNKRAEIAFNTFAYQAKRYIGEYLAILNGADIIVFTGGAGQNSFQLRQKILNEMENLGVVLDEQLNANNPAEGLISSAKSRIQIAVLPTNEELIVATEVKKLLDQKSTKA